MKRLVVSLVLLAALAPRSAGAHPIDIGYLRIEADGAALTTTLDLDIVAAGQLIRVDPEGLTAEGAAAFESRLARATYRATQISSDTGTCTWSPTGSIRREKRAVLLTAVATCPDTPHALTWKLAFLEQLPSTFQMFIQAPAFGEQMPILDRAAPTLELKSPEPPRSFFGSLRTGALRLRILDQLVFLLALLLVGDTRRERFAGAGASFATQLATLGLGAAGILRPPAGLIVPLVALSIIVAAFLAIARVPHRRVRLAAELGCIHGVAIAAAGRDAHLGFGFYLGTELVYLAGALVLVALPLRRATFVLGAVACAYASYLLIV